MWKAILVGFLIGFAAMGLGRAAGLLHPAAETAAPATWLATTSQAMVRLVDACRPRPAYPGLA